MVHTLHYAYGALNLIIVEHPQALALTLFHTPKPTSVLPRVRAAIHCPSLLRSFFLCISFSKPNTAS